MSHYSSHRKCAYNLFIRWTAYTLHLEHIATTDVGESMLKGGEKWDEEPKIMSLKDSPNQKPSTSADLLHEINKNCLYYWSC